MKNSNVLKGILFISGLLLIIVGSAGLFAPVAFNAPHGIDLGENISLLNNTRSSGGLLLAIGALIMSGIFIPKLRFTSTLLSAVIFLSYGTFRVLAIVMDGMPADGLVKATVVEFIIGFLGLFALIKYREE